MSFLTHWMTVVALVLLLIDPGVTCTSGSPVRSVCPTANETAGAVMVEFLTDSSWADARQEVGATGFSADDIRRLEDSEDTNMCEKLQEYTGGNEEEIADVFYKVDSFFFIIDVPAQKSTPEDLNLYGESVVVFKTTSLDPKGTFIR